MVNLFFDRRENGSVLLPSVRGRLADIPATGHVTLRSREANPPLDEALLKQGNRSPHYS